MAANNTERKYVSVKFLQDRYEISRETVYKYIKDYGFPAKIKLTPGASRWLLSEVEAWETERSTQSSALNAR